MNPTLHRISTLIQQLSGPRIEGIQNSRVRPRAPLLSRQEVLLPVLHTLVMNQPLDMLLAWVFTRREREQNAVGNHGRVRQIEVGRNPGGLQNWLLGVAV